MAKLINGPKRWKQFIKSSISDVQDPIFLTFDLDFFPPFKADYDGLAWDSLFKPEYTKGTANDKYKALEWSAQDWLYTYGSAWTKDNYMYLNESINLLKDLQESPWYFQSISGVDTLWKSGTRVKEGDKTIELTINCLDSIQQPLLRFAEYYRRAIYDFDRLSYNLPDNLRTFDMTVTLFEIRDIVDRFGNLDDGLHQLKYRLYRCEFDFSDILGGVSNSEIKAYTEDKPFSTSFKIRALWASEETPEQTTESDYRSLSIFSGALSSLEGKAQRFLSSAARLPARLAGTIINDLQTQLETKVIGNVYNPDRINEVGNANAILGRRSPVGPSISNINADIYPGVDPVRTVNNGDLGDVYP